MFLCIRAYIDVKRKLEMVGGGGVNLQKRFCPTVNGFIMSVFAKKGEGIISPPPLDFDVCMLGTIAYTCKHFIDR